MRLKSFAILIYILGKKGSGLSSILLKTAIKARAPKRRKLEDSTQLERENEEAENEKIIKLIAPKNVAPPQFKPIVVAPGQPFPPPPERMFESSSAKKTEALDSKKRPFNVFVQQQKDGKGSQTKKSLKPTDEELLFGDPLSQRNNNSDIKDDMYDDFNDYP